MCPYIRLGTAPPYRVDLFLRGRIMDFNFLFFFNSLLLGAGLAMDAFSVSLANGLGDPRMKGAKMCGIAGTFAIFQAAMPMLGWICVHTVVKYFESFGNLIPWIALVLLCYIGGKMLIEGIRSRGEEACAVKMTFTTLLVQGIATSIDALSVGFTISDYGLVMALVCALIIAVVTFIICMTGLCLGKVFGTRLAGKAGIFGGMILIIIGLEIFIKGVFFS